MKTLLLGQGIAVDEVYCVMSAGDAGEDGDLAICKLTTGKLIEVVICDGKVRDIFVGWTDA